jgi:hypothetical protein
VRDWKRISEAVLDSLTYSVLNRELSVPFPRAVLAGVTKLPLVSSGQATTMTHTGGTLGTLVYPWHVTRCVAELVVALA